MKLHRTLIQATLENTKGREFEVEGIYWGDGTIRVSNPRSKRYPFEFLYTEPDIFFEEDPKRLYFLGNEDSEIGEISPFRIKTMFLVLKPVKKRGRKTS